AMIPATGVAASTFCGGCRGFGASWRYTPIHLRTMNPIRWTALADRRGRLGYTSRNCRTCEAWIFTLKPTPRGFTAAMQAEDFSTGMISTAMLTRTMVICWAVGLVATRGPMLFLPVIGGAPKID